jgi:hypothetical protein
MYITLHSRGRTAAPARKWLATAALALLAAPGMTISAQEAPASNREGQGDAALSPTAAVAAKPLLDPARVAQNRSLWPKEVTLLKPMPFAVVYAGRVAGETIVPAWTRLPLIRVDAAQVELENQGARQWVPADSTDLVARASRLRDAALAAQAPDSPRPAAPPAGEPQEPATDHQARAREVTEEIQRDFWNPQTGLYSDEPNGKQPASAWACGVMFSALAAATRHDPEHYQPVLRKFFEAFDAYWDRKQTLGGYEPLPGGGNGNDKYYDDNEWLAIAFLEAYAVTGESIYSRRAEATVKFVLSGWDETYLQGGIWWHETHEKKVRCKNTCANAPAAVACLRLARISQPTEARDLIAMARKIVDWTVTNLQLPNGLFADTKNIEGDGMNKASLTYNSALMVRAFLGLYQVGGNPVDLQNAQRVATAANALLDQKTGVFRDHKKWGHLMVEADLALYRTTKEPYLLERARRNADAYYEAWKKDGPVDLISAASVARVLWLMADTETVSGRNFWRQEDLPSPGMR